MQPRRIQHGGITGHVFRFHFQKTGQQPPVTLHRRVAAPYMHVKLLHIGKHLVQAVHIRLGSPYHAVHLPQLRAYPVAFPVPQGSHHAAHPGQGGGQAVRAGSPGQQIRSVHQGAPFLQPAARPGTGTLITAKRLPQAKGHMPGHLLMGSAVHPFHHSLVNIGARPALHFHGDGVPVPAGKTATPRFLRISQQQHPVRAVGALLQPVFHKRAAQGVRLHVVIRRIPQTPRNLPPVPVPGQPQIFLFHTAQGFIPGGKGLFYRTPAPGSLHLHAGGRLRLINAAAVRRGGLSHAGQPGPQQPLGPGRRMVRMGKKFFQHCFRLRKIPHLPGLRAHGRRKFQKIPHVLFRP